MRYVNKFIARGTIVGIRATLRETSVILATDGGSRRGRKDESSDYPNIMFYDSSLLGAVRAGDRITIQGHIQTTRYKNEDGKTKYRLLLVGDRVVKTKRLLANYVELNDEYNGGAPDDQNLVILAGRLYSKIKSSPSSTSIVLQIGDGTHTNYARGLCFMRQSDALNDAEVGDNVAIAGALRTRKPKTRTDDVEQNIIVLDAELLEKIPKETPEETKEEAVSEEAAETAEAADAAVTE